MPTRLCFHLNPKFNLFRFGRIKCEGMSQFIERKRGFNASMPIYCDRTTGINTLSFGLQNNIPVRKMAAMKCELLNEKSRFANVTDRYLNSRHKTGIKISIIIAYKLLALAQFEGHLAHFLTVIKNNPKADEGYQDCKDRKPVCKGHIEFLDHKDYINNMEPNYGS